MKMKGIWLAVALVFALFISGSAMATPGSNASVFIVHGINGGDLGLPQELPVDVYVDGTLAIPDFEFGQVVGPVSLPAGEYLIEINLAGTNTTVISANVPFFAGENSTVIAHLTANGAPTASKFVNNFSRSGPLSRVQVHHTAAAPAVDVYASPISRVIRPIFRNVPNGVQGTTLQPALTWFFSITPAGSNVPVLGPAPLSLGRNMTYLVYAVGTVNAERNSLSLIVIPVENN
jgi:hypothetical protein